MPMKTGALGSHLDRFQRKYEPVTESGCWIWTASVGRREYGQITIGTSRKDRKLMQAHRFSYEAHIGPIDRGLCVLHRCDVPSCVNPKHLFLGTYKDNARDMAAKKRQWKQARRIKNACR